jgi:hypothetical protein
MSMFLLFPAVGADHGRTQLIQAGVGTTTSAELVERMRQSAADLDAHPPPAPPAPTPPGRRAAHPSPRYSSHSLGSVSGENLAQAVKTIGASGSRSYLKTKEQAAEDEARERGRYRHQRRQRGKGE